MAEVILEACESKTLFPGYEARFIHTDRMTLAYVSEFLLVWFRRDRLVRCNGTRTGVRS